MQISKTRVNPSRFHVCRQMVAAFQQEINTKMDMVDFNEIA